MDTGCFFEIHKGIPREGPGTNAITRKAYSFLTELPESPVVLDVGCGPGQQSIELARISGGMVTARDLYQPYLDDLSAAAARRGVANIETMNDIVEIKKYVREYKDTVIDLILTVQQKEFNIPIKIEDQPDLNDIENFYQKGSGNFWVAVCGDDVVGTVSLLDIGEAQVALRKMFVKKEYRGRTYDVAAGLLNAAIEWCRSTGITDIFLGTTDKFLAAHRFYEKNNFRRISRNDPPSHFPIMKVDSIFYWYSLKE